MAGGEEGPVVHEDKIDEEDEDEDKPDEGEGGGGGGDVGDVAGEVDKEKEEGEGEEEAAAEEEEGERGIEEGGGDAETQAAETHVVTTYPRKQKKLPNAFNFCERAALTYNNPYRVSKMIFLSNIFFKIIF